MEAALSWTLTGGTVLRDGTLHRDNLHFAGGVIVSAVPKGQVFDASGLWLLPGIVDVHGDAIERIAMPRPGVSFELSLALQEADRQMLSNGIITAFHGLTVSWEPGLRSLASARAFVDALTGADLICDTRINFRWETFALEAVEDMIGWFDQVPNCIFSLNDHTTALIGQPPLTRKIVRMAERIGWSPEDCSARLNEVSARANEVPAAIVRVTSAARAAKIPMLAHDEVSPATRQDHRALGISASEFPMTEQTAAAARQAGEQVVFGAPNVLRGCSQNNAVDAAPAILSGLGTVLASDYYYPAPLQAAFVLAEKGMDFAAAWDCVSYSAAAIAGLSDRGRLQPGLRADVIAVCPKTRSVKAVFVAGEKKLHFG